ncbi:MAG: hypothetical protein JST00_45415 [Deltaproteobacteria bacterium]|nr:hypothetical protein [Deltaproteobacteria bacterium]
MFDRRALRAQAEEGGASDRAYVDAMIRMGWSRTADVEERRALADLHEAVVRASRRARQEVRTAIANADLRGLALRAHFDALPPLERDHGVEEVLGIAYPPLEEQAMPREMIAYQPSGYDEIVHALDTTALGPTGRLVDVGSGMGKAVLLASLLSGAEAVGIERDPTLHDHAVRAARDLSVERARFVNADASEAALDDADVYFLYIPFTGAVLEGFLARLFDPRGRGTPRRRHLCAGAIDVARHPSLAIAGPPSSWMHVYAIVDANDRRDA